jgi:hypothetical protein
VVVVGGSQQAALITTGGPTVFCQGGGVTLSANPGVSYIWSTGQTTQSITATASGNYVITVTFTTNISTSAPIHVTAVACVCSTLPSNLGASPVAAYNATLNWNISGADSLQIRLHDDAAATNYITGAFSGTFTSITLGVGPSRGYHWRIRPKCSGVWTPWSQCLYSTFTTPAFREGNPPANNFTLTELYRIENDGLDAGSEIESNMGIFPNPAASSATVSYKGYHEGIITMQLMDFTGKIKMTGNHSLAKGENHYALDLRNLPKGVYMVLINDNGMVSTKKIVVN